MPKVLETRVRVIPLGRIRSLVCPSCGIIVTRALTCRLSRVPTTIWFGWPSRSAVTTSSVLRSSRLRLGECSGDQRAVHLRVALVVKGGLRVRAYLLVEHLGFLTDEDPPGSGSHPVQDDGRRLYRGEPLVPEFAFQPRDGPAQVTGGEV